MDHADIWDEVAARHYDTPGVGMFAPEVLRPTVDRLRAMAGNGRALEMAIGTGRVAVPLAESGVPVAGIELCQPMIDQLRTKVSAEHVPVVVGDMRSARVDGVFDLVFLVFNAISNVLTQDDEIAVFENAARPLNLAGGSSSSCGCQTSEPCHPDAPVRCSPPDPGTWALTSTTRPRSTWCPAM